MSKGVLISIKPKWCHLIASGEKTIEVRKTRPKLEPPFKCYIYCTKDNTDMVPSRIWWKADKTGFQHIMNGKVIGEFVCDEITYFGNVATDPWKYLLGTLHEEYKRLVMEESCLTEEEIIEYGGKYGWHISDLKMYDAPQKLDWFVTEGDCDCMNCRDCSWFNRGNGYNVEDDCDLGYENIRMKKALKPLFKAPQSWCYVDDLGGQDGQIDI